MSKIFSLLVIALIIGFGWIRMKDIRANTTGASSNNFSTQQNADDARASLKH